MNFLKKLLSFLVVVSMLILGVLFSVQNTATVPLDLLVISLPERSIALWVLLAFALGGVIGMLVSIGLVWRLRASLMAANRKLAKQAAATGGEPEVAPSTNPEKET